MLLAFILSLLDLQYVNFDYDPYKQPSSKDVHAFRGTYAVA